VHLFLSSMFLLYFCLFFFNILKKKYLGKKMKNFIFSFDSFSGIACVFA
jgi:hypothetical protein